MKLISLILSAAVVSATAYHGVGQTSDLSKRSAEPEASKDHVDGFRNRGEEIVGRFGASFHRKEDDDFFRDDKHKKDDGHRRGGCSGRGCFERFHEEDRERHHHDRGRQHEDESEGFEERYWVEAIDGKHHFSDTGGKFHDHKAHDGHRHHLHKHLHHDDKHRLHHAHHKSGNQLHAGKHYHKRDLAAEEADEVVKRDVADAHSDYYKKEKYDDDRKKAIFADDRKEHKHASEKDDVEYFREIIRHDHDHHDAGRSDNYGQAHHHLGNHKHHHGQGHFHHGLANRKDLICVRGRCFTVPKPHKVKAHEG